MRVEAIAGPRGMRPAMQGALIVAVAILNELLFFRHNIFTGFERISADAADGRLMMANLEHWHHVWRGEANWQNPIFFHPIRGVLGFNDGLFANGTIFSLFRALGADWFAAYELMNMTLKLIGFLAFYHLARRILRIGVGYALLGASLFFQLNSTGLQLGHSQLLSVGFVPLMLILLHHLGSAVGRGAARDIWIFGITSIATYEAWLMSTFYMAWFFCLWLVVATGLFAAMSPPSTLLAYGRMFRQSAGALTGLLLVAVLASIPFMTTYLPTAGETGMHDIASMRTHTANPLDVLSVGPRNLLYGDAFRWLRIAITGYPPVEGERSTGFTPLLLLLFGLGAIYCWTRRIEIDQKIFRALLLAVILLWLASLRWGQFLAWDYIFDYFPGAKAIRTPARFQIFAGFFVVLVATVYLDRAGWLHRPAFVAVFAGLLLLEQYNDGYGWGIRRATENWIFTEIAAPPASCKSFFVLRAEPRENVSPGERDYYLHNVTAMIVAERFNLPTLNGFESITPPQWDLIRPQAPDYLDRVFSYARRQGVVDDLCSLEVPTRVWKAVTVPPGPS